MWVSLICVIFYKTCIDFDKNYVKFNKKKKGSECIKFCKL